MHQPAAIWALRVIVFDQAIGLAQNIILSQGQYALAAVVERIAKLRALVATSLLADTYTAPEIPGVLSDLCYQAGLASTILFNDSKRGHKESVTAFDLRKERIRYVNDLCLAQGLDTPTLKDRSVRNALTHIDEYLGDAVTRRPNVGWFIDVAIESRTQFSLPEGLELGFCRSYIRAEDRLVHLGREISVSALEAECVAILAVVFGVPPRAA